MSSCSTPMAGGRRRRSTKKSRKMRGGNFYGAAVDPSLGVGNLARPAVVNASADPVTGKLGPADTGAMNGGRRRRSRKGKSLYADIFKGGRKKRKTMRRRKLYGGANQMIPGNSSAGFTGEGSRGLANYVNVGSARANDVLSA